MSLNGEYFKKLRRDKKLSQECIATAISKTQSDISKYESGKINIPNDLLKPYSECLGAIWSKVSENLLLEINGFKLDNNECYNEKTFDNIIENWNLSMIKENLRIKDRLLKIFAKIVIIVESTKSYDLIFDKSRFYQMLIDAIVDNKVEYVKDILTSALRISINKNEDVVIEVINQLFYILKMTKPFAFYENLSPNANYEYKESLFLSKEDVFYIDYMPYGDVMKEIENFTIFQDLYVDVVNKKTFTLLVYLLYIDMNRTGTFSFEFVVKFFSENYLRIIK